MSTSLIGRKLGKYEIVDNLGQGGMAAVYKGYQLDVDRHVAIKVLPPHPGQDSQFVERFRLEARTIARLQHPYILPLYDYGDQDDILYLVMPYVEGGTLGDLIKKGPVRLASTERILQQVSSALDYAHKNGMIHRDIKPDNILISSEGDALLADFGITKLVGGGSNLTATGGVVGTPAYIAPEQAQGLPASNRSDIYSLGVVVFEMLAGVLPYTADTPMQILFQHVSEPVPNIDEVVSGLPPAVGPVLMRVLDKDPEARYPTAGDFASAFSKAVSGYDLNTTATQGRSVVPTPRLPVTAEAGFGVAATAQQSVRSTPQEQLYATNDLRQTVMNTRKGSIWLPVAGFAMVGLLIVVVVLLVLSLNRESVVVIGGVTDTPAATEGQSTAVAQAPAAEPTSTTAPPTNVPAVTFGTVDFTTTDSLGDSVIVQAENLAVPGDGLVYGGWLAGEDVEPLLLGRLSTNAFGEGVLSYTDPEGRFLPGSYNMLLITVEESIDDIPAGDVVYYGYVPPELAQVLNEVLVAAENGFDGGSLLDGAISEAETAARHAGLASGATNLSGMKTHAEHTINILLGTHDDYNGDGRGDNPGRGVGVLFFLDQIDAGLQRVITASADQPIVQANTELIRVCVVNVREWTNEVVTLEQEVLASEDFDAVQPQAVASTEVAASLVEGVDLNGNGQVEPFEGECGLSQISIFGVSVATMTLNDGAPPE